MTTIEAATVLQKPVITIFLNNTFATKGVTSTEISWKNKNFK